jgi:hypothetical protein
MSDLMCLSNIARAGVARGQGVAKNVQVKIF